MTEVNFASSLLQTINTMFSSLISSIDNQIYNILDDLIFINAENILDNNFLHLLGTNNNSSGIILICNSLLYGFLLYYAFSLILSYLTFSNVQKPSSFIFKILLIT